jgi:hypothetical protein
MLEIKSMATMQNFEVESDKLITEGICITNSGNY